MGFNLVGNENEISLGVGISFGGVSVEKVSHFKGADPDSSEVNAYIAKLADLDGLSAFIASCLKLTYVELFDGEPEEEMIDAYDNLVSDYCVSLSCLTTEEVESRLTAYPGYLDIEAASKILSAANFAFELKGEGDSFLVSNSSEIMLLECEHE